MNNLKIRKLLICVIAILLLFNHSILAENSLTEESNQMQEKEMEKLTVHDLLEQHENGTLSDMDFLRALGECEVFTSTPFGELETGGKVLFVVPGPEGIGYYPVFSSVEAGEKYFEGCGRKGYMLMQGSFQSKLESINDIRGEISKIIPVQIGIIIDPEQYAVTIDPSMMDTVLELYRH
jgi:hypothetical protein